MTKKLFEEVDFSEFEPPEEVVELTIEEYQRKIWNQTVSMSKAIGVIKGEIERIKECSSELCPPIHFPKGISPFLTAFERLTSNCIHKNIVNFLELSKQDLGLTAALQFQKWVAEDYPEIKKLKL